MTEHIIFDLDGTLVDSVQICTEILNAMHRDRGSSVVLGNADTRRYISQGGAPMVEALLGSACVDPDKDIIEFRARYADLATPTNCLFAGVREGLAALRRQGFTLSICSNKPQLLCDKVLSDLGLNEMFDTVVGSKPGLLLKPATDLMDLVLRNLDAQADQCVFVGDSELDHGLANACNMRFMFVTYGYADIQCNSDDVQSFNNFTDVIVSLLPTDSGNNGGFQTTMVING
jgi:phosphoglycolate phosphatase